MQPHKHTHIHQTFTLTPIITLTLKPSLNPENTSIVFELTLTHAQTQHVHS